MVGVALLVCYAWIAVVCGTFGGGGTPIGRRRADSRVAVEYHRADATGRGARYSRTRATGVVGQSALGRGAGASTQRWLDRICRPGAPRLLGSSGGGAH